MNAARGRRSPAIDPAPDFCFTTQHLLEGGGVSLTPPPPPLK